MPTKKKPAARKTTAKKVTPKKTVAKKSAASRSAANDYVTRPFLQAKFTEQTVYWLIIGVAVVALAAWVLSLQVQLNEMYDAIDASSTSYVIPSDSEF